MTAPIYILTNSVERFLFINTLFSIYYLWTSCWWSLWLMWGDITVLFCISLRIISVEYFSCICWPSVASLEKYLFISSAHYLFIYFSKKDYLHILEINPLFVAVFADIFSHSISCHLVYGVLCCAKAFMFNWVAFDHFCFYLHYSRRWEKKIAIMLSFLRNEQIVSHSNWTILNSPHQCTRISVFSSTIVIFILTLDIFY